jgi:hypothetical protein
MSQLVDSMGLCGAVSKDQKTFSSNYFKDQFADHVTCSPNANFVVPTQLLSTIWMPCETGGLSCQCSKVMAFHQRKVASNTNKNLSHEHPHHPPPLPSNFLLKCGFLITPRLPSVSWSIALLGSFLRPSQCHFFQLAAIKLFKWLLNRCHRHPIRLKYS